MKINNPKRRDDLLAQESGEEVMLYDSIADEMHILNPTAQFIWARCDGLHSIEQIADELRIAFAVAPEVNVQNDIVQTLNQFNTKSLLQVLPEHISS